MNNSFVDELKRIFKTGDIAIRIIFITTIVFLVELILNAVLGLLKIQIPFTDWFAMPSDLSAFIFKPWTLITYMFFHGGIWHILFNMYLLFIIGKIFLTYFSKRQFLTVYFLGGIFGGLLYLLSYNLFPVFENHAQLVGASAGVTGVLIALGFYAPNHVLNLMILGPVRMKYVVIALFVLSTLVDFSINTGGKISHIGGAVLGYLFVSRYNKGKDMSIGFYKFLSFFGLPRKGMRVEWKKSPKQSSRKFTDEEWNIQRTKDDKRVDVILDKIKKSGYESLTKEEKEFLFKQSNK